MRSKESKPKAKHRRATTGRTIAFAGRSQPGSIARRPSTALAPVAPIEGASTAPVSVSEAVHFINGIVLGASERVAQGMLQIGQYVLKHFFSGDGSQVQFRGPKAASFRAVADHPDLHMSASSLHRAVHLALQDRELRQRGVQLSERLSTSHLVELLRVPSPDDKRRYIEEVESTHISVRALHERIDAVLAAPRPALALDSGGATPACLPRPIRAFVMLDVPQLLQSRRFRALNGSDASHWIAALEVADRRIAEMIAALRTKS